MKVFLDSNVWISAFTTRGLCEDLVRTLLRRHGRGSIEVLLSKPVREETLRILVEKFHATEDDLAPVRITMDQVNNISGSKTDLPVKISDPNDIMIVASALDGGATIFVTGDKALLALRTIGNMTVNSPRELFERFLSKGK